MSFDPGLPFGARLPVVFVGQGTARDVIAESEITQSWAALGAEIPRPDAILAISSHWYTYGTGVTAMETPPTLHDLEFQPLRHIQYPAPGHPGLAERVAELLAPCPVVRDQSWGLDHGSWPVLLKAFPEADIPVVQLSIDGSQRPQVHYDLGRRLAPLREEGVLILASGNIVHNPTHMARGTMADPHPWAERFDGVVRDKLAAREWDVLIDYESLGDDAALCVPTPEHYLPLLYAMGAADPSEPVSFPIEGIDRGALSKRSVVFGHF